MITVALVLGTRPEAIKLAPLARELRGRPEAVRLEIVFSGQHPDLVQPVLDFFGLAADHTLGAMRPGQGLAELSARALTELNATLARLKPDWVIAQGDTTTAMCAGLAAFYQQIPLAHLEAGLRTNDPRVPFPEEINRRILGQLAALHWAPTRGAATALAREGLPLGGGRVFVTGNTGIDAVLIGRALLRSRPMCDPDLLRVEKFRAGHPSGAFVLMTGHRRENLGEPAREACRAVRAVAGRHSDSLFVYPMHPNPLVRATVKAELGGLANVLLTEPKDYPVFLQLMDWCDAIVTDSGGVQEEAPALGKVVLVTRARTERPEGIATGHIRLVGEDRVALEGELEELILARRSSRHQLLPALPYGDGRAASRCVASLLGENFMEFDQPAQPRRHGPA